MSSQPGALGLLVLAIWAVATPPAAAQHGGVKAALDDARALYQEGRLQEAVQALRAVIVRLNEAIDLEGRTLRLADAHFHLGLAHLAMRQESAAIENFRQVVALDPERQLEPAIYAPKVLTAFEQARSEVMAHRRSEMEEASTGEGAGPAADAAPIRPLAVLKIVPGTKVRVRRSDTRSDVQGRLFAIDDQSITVGTEQWTVAVPIPVVERVQMVRSQKNHWLSGMLIGAGVGVLIGALETPGCTGDGCYTRAENIAYGGFGAGLIGALIGALYKTDEWVDVSLQPSPAARATQVVLRCSFRWGP